MMPSAVVAVYEVEPKVTVVFDSNRKPMKSRSFEVGSQPSVPFSRDSKLSRMRALCFTGREKPVILTHLATPWGGSPEM
jgi:hypothetical protein